MGIARCRSALDEEPAEMMRRSNALERFSTLMSLHKRADGETGVVVGGCHRPDPDEGFGKEGECRLPSAGRGEGRAAGRVLAASLLPALLCHHREGGSSLKDLERYLLRFQNVSLKIMGLGSASID